MYMPISIFIYRRHSFPIKHVDGCMSYCDVFHGIKRRTPKLLIVVFLQDRQCTYNLTPKRFRETVVAMEKEEVFHILRSASVLLP
jgi:hypothetical protein